MATDNPDTEHWQRVAEQWIAWARTPDHDPFWAYRPRLLDFVGRGPGDALDVGCGEGRVSRVLKERGYRVTATDPVAPLVQAAREADSADHYEVAPAGELPFGSASFDLVMAYNVLMDVKDVTASVREMARVLRPSGTLMLSIVHPFADRGRFESAAPDAAFRLEGSYFGRERFDGVDERDGLRMHFAGWSQPLQNYAIALENAGLAITALREPVPVRDEGAADLEQWSRLPLFLWLKARPLQ